MRKIQTQSKLRILFALVLLFGIQTVFAQDTRYTSSVYKVAFQTPKNSVKDAASTEKRLAYTADENKFGIGSRLEFVIDESDASEELSQFFGTDDGMELFMKEAVKGIKDEIGGSGEEPTVLEKQRLKLAGLNTIKFVVAFKISGVKLRIASYNIIVPEHKRMYSFIAVALDDNFDKWLPAAEESIKSFELLKHQRK